MAQGIGLAIHPRGVGLWSDRGGSTKIENPSGLCYPSKLCYRILLDLKANTSFGTALLQKIR
jgi:hypothetical protein